VLAHVPLTRTYAAPNAAANLRNRGFVRVTWAGGAQNEVADYVPLNGGRVPAPTRSQRSVS